MPELPEVETTCRGIAPRVVGRTVSQVIVRCERLRWPIPTNLADCLSGKTLETLDRRGKYLQWHFATGTLLVHLGMSGSLRVYPSPPPLAGRHDHVEWWFGDDCVRLRDPRRFGAVVWVPKGEVSPLLQRLGVEPLSDGFTGAYLFKYGQKRRQAIKTVLMNAAVVVGVGNIYANESLFVAGIHPQRPANQLSIAECTQLVGVIRQVLQAAIEAGGSSLRDYVGGDGAAGYFQQQHFVYGRDGKPCRQCGHGIEKITLGQRGTFFCPHCQA